MKATISLYSSVRITGDIADTDRRCDAYLYGHTTRTPSGRFDVLDGGDNGGSYFVLITTVTRSFGSAQTVETAALEAFKEALHLRQYQLDRFASGMYPTWTFASQEEAQNFCCDEVLR